MKIASALAAIAAASLAGCVATPTESSSIRLIARPANSAPLDPDVARLRAARNVLNEAGFTGPLAASFAPRSTAIAHAPNDSGDPPRRPSEPWPWASVTKQVMAVLAMQAVDRGELSLDGDIGQYLPRLATNDLTTRDLLSHKTNLANPDDQIASADDFPPYYSSEVRPLDYCMSGGGERPADGGWRYNNCDYIVLGAVLERATGESLASLIASRIGEPAGWTDTRLLGADDMRDYVSRETLYDRVLPRYGASAALVGPLEDMLRFDRALLGGELLGEESLAVLWESDPALGYMALGQWVFDAPLSGCEAAVQIVERRGHIGKY